MTKNPAVLIGAALLLVAVGFTAGYLVAEKRSTEQRMSVTDRPVPATAGGTSDRPRRDVPDAAGSADEERAKLRERIVILESQLRTRGNTADPKPSPEELAEAGRAAYEDLLALESGSLDPERFRSLIASLSRMNPAVAKVLIERYRLLRSGGASAKEQFVAIQLALMCGGPEAASFLQGVLTDRSLDPELRSKVLLEVASTGAPFFSIRRLPVDEPLGATAMTLIRSTNAEDRRAGAGLLGGVSTPASRGELVQLLGDSDLSVKQAAIRSLGLVGDLTTRKVLEPYATQTDNEWLRKAAVAAIKDLDETRK